MRILFDQGVPVAIAGWLREHKVRTTLEEGWDTRANGELLRVAENAGFDLLLTTDNNIAYQQNLKGRCGDQQMPSREAIPSLKSQIDNRSHGSVFLGS